MGVPAADQPDGPRMPAPASGECSGLSESSHIVIIGGGPHALAALSALHERSLSFPEYNTDQAFATRVGFGSMKKTGSVSVIDPGQQFIETWNKRFEVLEIQHLRSPAFAHPAAYEPTALLNFAVREGREREIINVPECCKRVATEDFSAQEPMLQGLPSSALFRDFCSSLASTLPHTWLSGAVTAVRKEGHESDKFVVEYAASADGTPQTVLADAVVLATGAAGKWNVPEPFAPHVGSSLVAHTEQLFAEGAADQGAARRKGERLLVIGGGITAAQAALAGVAAGCQVVLRSHRPLRTQAFDVGECWLDQRHHNRLRSEFFHKRMEERRQAIREAVNGGSVPELYVRELRRHEAAGAVSVQVDGAIDASTVHVEGGALLVNGTAFDRVILATGVAAAPLLTPLYQQLQAELDAPTMDGLPEVDSSLRWVDSENLFVLGANAALELGPGGANLMGAMRGAKTVAQELRDLMWTTAGRKVAQLGMYVNPWSILGDECDSIASGSDSDEE